MKIKLNMTQIGAILGLLLIAYQSISAMIWQYSSSSTALVSLVMVIIVVVAVYALCSKPIATRSVEMLLLVYYLDSIIVCLLNGYTSMYLQEPTMVFTHMYWVFVFILFKEAVKSKNLSAKTFTRIFSILIIVCFVLFCRYYMTNQSEKYSLTGLNVVYYLLFMFPILLMSNDKKIVTVGVVLNLIAVLLSGKRGALIAIVAALVIWRQSDLNYKSSKEKMLKMLFAIAVGVVAVYGVLEIVERLDLDILDRMQSLLAGEDSGGSGRTDIWETYWEHMKTDSPWKNLIGRGYSAAKRNPSYRGLGLGWAHNDFLQILFDYGIIGLGIFVSIIVKLFAIARRMKAVQYRYYAPFLSSLVIFVLCCCFSMVTMLPQWILPMAAFWGFVIGDYEQERMAG